MQNKRYHIIIASIVFATLMWISINMGYEYTIIKYIPVVMENLREDQALKYPIPKVMTVQFRGTGWQLLNITLSPNVKYYIDGRSIGTREYIVTAGELAEHVKLPFNIHAVDVQPDTLRLALDEFAEKRVPVVPRLVINPKDGFGMVGSLRVTPESVTVSGSKTLLSRIAQWTTSHHRYDNQRSAIDEMLPLDESTLYSLEVYPGTVRVQADIQHFAEKTFPGVAVNVLGVPSNREVVFIPPRMDVIARGGIDQLAKLSTSDFEASVEFSTLLSDSSGNVVPSLTSPQTVKVIRRMPEQFQFIIRKKL